MTWHAEPEVLSAYHRGDTHPTINASMEAHLLSCDVCRAALADHARKDWSSAIVPLDQVWSDIVDALDAPRPSVTERVLGRAGLAPHTARLLAATPALRLSWATAMAMATIAVVALAAGEGPGTFAQLLLAPLLPPLGVALAYGSGIDPAYELGVATPMHGLRLVLLRTTAVVAAAMAAGLATAPLLPWSWTAFAWLLPAFALASVTLALRAFVASPLRAAIAVDTAWAVGLVLVQEARAPGIEGVGAATQIALGVAGVVALVVVVARETTFAEGIR